MAELPDLAPTTVTVAPTTTTVATLATGQTRTIAVQVENLDLTQTFNGSIERQLNSSIGWAPSVVQDFLGVLPGASVVVDLDVVATHAVRLTGIMDGAGGDVRVTARRRS